MAKQFRYFIFYLAYLAGALGTGFSSSATAKEQGYVTGISGPGRYGLSGLMDRVQMYAADGKLRVVFAKMQELTGFPSHDVIINQGVGNLWLLDTKDNVAVNVDPRSPNEEPDYVWDASNPCRGIRHTRCSNPYKTKINGRNVISWDLDIADSHRKLDRYMTLWMDPKMNIPLAYGGGGPHNFGFDSEHIQSLPRSLFKIPAGYKKMTIMDYFIQH